MLNEDTRKIWYDLQVQELTGSIIASVIFHRIKYLIENNIEDGDKAFRYKCFYHLQKPGVCITHAEIAEYLGTDKSKISYAIDKLKSSGLIGMDYVVLETMRAPFFFLDSGCNILNQQESRNMRYYFYDSMKKVNCFNSAVMHGHIAHCNKDAENKKAAPLVQSFSGIAENLGLTVRQIQLSFKKLCDEKMILSSIHKDGRYSLVAVVPDLLKSVGGSPKKCEPIPEKTYTDHLKSVYNEGILGIFRYLGVEEGGEETPPPEYKIPEDRKMRFGKIRILQSQLSELLTLAKHQYVVDGAFTRYHEECAKLHLDELPGNTMFHLLRFVRFFQQDLATSVSKEKTQEPIQKEKNAEPIHIVEPHHMAVDRQMRKYNTSKRAVLLAHRVNEIRKICPERYSELAHESLERFSFESFSLEENQAFQQMTLDQMDKVVNISNADGPRIAQRK